MKPFILKRESLQISHRETNQQKTVLGKPFVTITKLTARKNCTFDAKSHPVVVKPVTKFLVSYQTCVGVGALIWIRGGGVIEDLVASCKCSGRKPSLIKIPQPCPDTGMIEVDIFCQNTNMVLRLFVCQILIILLSLQCPLSQQCSITLNSLNLLFLLHSYFSYYTSFCPSF